MGQNIVIIGDGIAGATAGVTARKRDPEAQITIITDEPEPLYNRVQIKDFAKGQRDEASTFIHDLEFYDKHTIRLRLNTRVVEVRDAESRIVTADGTRYSYDRLLIATGGTPRKLPVDGGRAEGVFTFWTFGDARRILAAAKEADHGVVVGAGLLGIDLAVIFGIHHVETKYLMRGDRWWRDGLSKEGSAIVERGLAKLGVECIFGENVERFVTDKGRITQCVGTTGRVYPADIGGVAIGLRYNHDFLKGSRVKVGEGVLTDECMRTSAPNVYSAGDIAQYYDVALDRVNQNGSWASALKQGEVAGTNMTGGSDEFRLVDTYSIDHFDDFFIMSVGNIYGDSAVDRAYDAGNYRRVVFKQGRPIGGVFVGDVKQAGTLRKLISLELSFKGCEDRLLAPELDKEWTKLPARSSLR